MVLYKSNGKYLPDAEVEHEPSDDATVCLQFRDGKAWTTDRKKPSQDPPPPRKRSSRPRAFIKAILKGEKREETAYTAFDHAGALEILSENALAAQNEVEKLKTTKVDLTMRLTQSGNEIAEMQELVNNLSGKLERLEREHDEELEYVKSAYGEGSEELEKRIRHYEGQESEFSTQIKKLEKKVNREKQGAEGVEKELKEAKAKIAVLQSTDANKSAEKEKLVKTVRSQERDLRSAWKARDDVSVIKGKEIKRVNEELLRANQRLQEQKKQPRQRERREPSPEPEPRRRERREPSPEPSPEPEQRQPKRGVTFAPPRPRPPLYQPHPVPTGGPMRQQPSDLDSMASCMA